MPSFFRALADRLEKNTQPLNRYEGFQGSGAVVVRDRRGTAKAEIPNVSEKANGGTLSDDPLAIYKPTGAKSVDAAKAMGNFTGWTFAVVNATAHEVATSSRGFTKATVRTTRSRTSIRSSICSKPSDRYRAEVRHESRRSAAGGNRSRSAPGVAAGFASYG